MPWCVMQGGWRGRITKRGGQRTRASQRPLDRHHPACPMRTSGSRSTERMASTPLGRRPPTRGARFPPGVPLASVDLWPWATRCRALPMDGVVAAIPDLRAVGSALLLPTAESGRVMRSSRPYGPLHRRPRLRHEAHRRGAASAVSRPLYTRARVVEHVCLSAQPPADRSVQRLMQRRRCTAPAHGWVARRCSGPPGGAKALQRTLRLCPPPPPPRGRTRKAPAPLRSARAAGSYHPPSPSGGFAARFAPGGKRLCRSCLLREAALPSRLGLPPHGGGHAQQRAGLLGLHLSLACLSSLLARLAMYCRRAPASRPGPQRGWGCA